MKLAFLVFLAGGLGTLTRYIFLVTYPNSFAVVFINIAGSFLAGFILNFSNHPALIIGFLGGFTTFSAFSNEIYTLAQNNTWSAFGYIILSVVGGLVGFVIGKMVASAL